MLLNVMGVPEPEYRPKIRAFLYQTPHAGDRNIPIPACPQPGIKAKVTMVVGCYWFPKTEGDRGEDAE